MAALDLLIEKVNVVGLPTGGNLVLNPSLIGLNQVLLRRLYCWLRVPLIPGAHQAIIDTGAPLTIFPHKIWHGSFHWQSGRDYDELSVAGYGTTFRGQVLSARYAFRLARLRVPVDLAGHDLNAPRLRLDDLVCQLADPGGPPFIILGLWGGPLVGRKLAVETAPGSDDLLARLEW